MSVPRTKSTRLLTRPGWPVPSLAASRPGPSGADTRACSSIRMGIRGRWRTTLAGRCAPTARSASAASWSAAAAVGSPWYANSRGRPGGGLRHGHAALAQQLAAARLGNDLAVLEDDIPSADREARPPADLAAVVDRVVRVGLHRPAVDGAAELRVEYDEVSVTAHGDRPLPRIEPEEPGRVRGGELDEAGQRDPAGQDAGREQHRHDRLQVRHAGPGRGHVQ